MAINIITPTILIAIFFTSPLARANDCHNLLQSNPNITRAIENLKSMGIAYTLKNRDGAPVIGLQDQQKARDISWLKMATKIQKILDHRVEFDEVWNPGETRSIDAARSDLPYPRIQLNPYYLNNPEIINHTILTLAHEAVHAKTNQWFLKHPESDESNWAIALLLTKNEGSLHPNLKNTTYDRYLRIDEVKAYYRGYRASRELVYLSRLNMATSASADLLRLARIHLQQQVDSDKNIDILSVYTFYSFHPRHLIVEINIPQATQDFQIQVPYYNTGDVSKVRIDRQHILYRIKIAEALVHRYSRATAPHK